MQQELFKPNVLTIMLAPTFFAVGIVVIYFVNGNISPWIFLVLLVPFILLLANLKERLLVEGDTLRYQRVLRRSEVSLKKVSQITVRSVWSTDSDNTTTVERIVYVVDEYGRTFFTFPSYLIKRKDMARFKEAVTSVNPDIKFS